MTKELDRRFRHVGRIKRAWGTSHKPTIRAMEQMLDGLFQRGRLDILRSLQDGTVSATRTRQSPTPPRCPYCGSVLDAAGLCTVVLHNPLRP